MSIFRFLVSKTFVKHLVIAGILLIVLVFLTLQMLKVQTNHGEHVAVPDLSKKSLHEVAEILEATDLRFEVLDSTDYNPKYPVYSVIDQNPKAGSQVKQNRKIYLTINPSGYRKVTIPKVVQITRRSAEATLKAVGLEIGKVTYVDNIGKDMVLGLEFKGKEIQPGDQLIKTSKIDLICGNGNDINSMMEDNSPETIQEDGGI